MDKVDRVDKVDKVDKVDRVWTRCGQSAGRAPPAIPGQTLSPCDQLSDAPANIDVIKLGLIFNFFFVSSLSEVMSCIVARNNVHFCCYLVLISVEEAGRANLMSVLRAITLEVE